VFAWYLPDQPIRSKIALQQPASRRAEALLGPFQSASTFGRAITLVTGGEEKFR
jgi:hypothetical protein